MLTRTIALACSAVFLLGGTTSVIAQPKQSAADIEKYGVYPIAYRELIQRWLEPQLRDPASAIYEWTSEPTRVVVNRPGEKPLAAWMVDFKVNSRNMFGTYTGKQKRRVYIRNGEVMPGRVPR